MHFEEFTQQLGGKSAKDVTCCKLTVMLFRLLSLIAFANTLLLPNRLGLISTR